MEYSEALYEVVESETRGKIVLSKQDMLPGVELLREDPLLIESKELSNSPRCILLEKISGVPATAFAAYEAFKLLTEEDQKKFLDLYGPTDGPTAKFCREQLKVPEMRVFNLDVEELVQVVMILRFNGFESELGSATVYNNSTRFAHSCFPNCIWTSGAIPLQKIVRIIRPVKKGEELTFSYDSSFTINPTHERRTKHLRSKEFLCNCERCSDPADITRRFPCCANDGCSGYHCVSQPLSTDSPYMLPCNKCSIQPSASWQARMLALEKQEIAKLPVNEDIRQGFLATVHAARLRRQSKSGSVYDNRIFNSDPVALPQHYSAVYFLEIKLEYALFSHDERSAVKLARMLQRLYQDLVDLPFEFYTFSLIVTSACCDILGTAESLELSCSTLPKVLRLDRMLKDPGDESIPYSKLTTVMQRLKLCGHPHTPPSVQNNCCAFCEASPSDMAITLSLCGRCQSVQYCGRECQAAHWKLHKSECKKL